MEQFDKLVFHDLIKDYIFAYSSTMAAYLGWHLLSEQELADLLRKRSGNDRVGLAVKANLGKGHNISFSFSKAVYPIVADKDDHIRVCSLLSQQLIGHSYETLREHGHLPRHDLPVAEFFRHVRNGCFHGNRFNLFPGEPKQLAEWRGMIIDRTLNGKMIFRGSKSGKEFFLNFGDPIVLLHDLSEEI